MNKDCLLYEGKKKDCPVSQNGKTYRLLNKSIHKIMVFEVDPCLIPDKNKRKCDNLFLIENEQSIKRAHFIELKGAGLTDAIRQIESSVSILLPEIKEYKVFGRIVGKRMTPNIKSRRAKLDEKLKQLGGDLKIETKPEFVETV